MNTIDCILALEAGQSISKSIPVKVRGYLPCRLATGRPHKDGRRIMVIFEGGRRMLFPFTVIRFGEEAGHNRLVKA